MVVYLDVDKYLNKGDYRLCLREAKWPWKETHFIKLSACFICKKRTNSKMPRHLCLRTDKKSTFKMILHAKHFWCQNCMFAIYEHYITDECNICADF